MEQRNNKLAMMPVHPVAALLRVVIDDLENFWNENETVNPNHDSTYPRSEEILTYITEILPG